MEVSGIVTKFHGTSINAQLLKSCSYPCGISLDNHSKSKVCMGIVNSKCFPVVSSSGHADSGQSEYYVCAEKKKKQSCEKKKQSCEMKKVEKNLKMIKKLAKDMSLVSNNNPLISGAVESLLQDLQRLRIAQKELKRKKKAELNATSMRTKYKSGPFKSSDSESEKVIKMRDMRTAPPKQSIDNELKQAVEETTLDIVEEKCCRNDECSNVEMQALPEQKVEVCLGGKCKKMGAMAILEEFEKKIGEGGAVVGCKCIGKCKTGPNVRLQNMTDGIQAERGNSSFKSQTNPLYIGVGLNDVGGIVAMLLEKKSNDK